MEQPERNKIYYTDALSFLRTCPDNFLDHVVTSPPYYLLRSYQTEPLIWGGEPECEHEWGAIIPNKKMDSRDPVKKLEQGGQVGSNLKTMLHSQGNCGRFCLRCGAWQGELGLEPSVHLYIDHLTQIFTEIYRVLKPTGTCFVNLGDSYASGPTGHKTVESARASSPTRIGSNQGAIDAGSFSKIGRGVREKSLFQVPERFGLAMTDRIGFIKRNKINWWKRSTMPSSAKDRFTVDFEDIHFYTKSPEYYFETQWEPTKADWQARNGKPLYKNTNMSVPVSRAGNARPYERIMRTTWDVNTEGQSLDEFEHYAKYPTRLVEIPIKAGCPEMCCPKCGSPIAQLENQTWECDCNAGTVPGLVYDPFSGSGTTAMVAHRIGRDFIGTELQTEYHEKSTARLENETSRGRLFR